MGTDRTRTGRWWGALALVVAAGAACSSENAAPPTGSSGSPSNAGEGNVDPSGGTSQGESGAPQGESGAPQGESGAPHGESGAPHGESGAASGGVSGSGVSGVSGAPTQGGGEPTAGGAGGEPTVGGECTPGATRACYDGAPGTKGVAACRGGTSTCDARGAWGACQGQVVPVTEICEDGLDNDCNGVADDISDLDGDGWTVCEGDCCEVAGTDCAAPALVNPAAIDARHVAKNGAVTFTDDDCSGTAGDSRAACDAGLGLEDATTASAAAALDICQNVTKDSRSWGLVSVRYTTPDGRQVGPGKQAGLPGAFGAHVVPQQGERMLLLSTGHARAPGDPDACGSNSCKTSGTTSPPPGFPQQATGCSPVQVIYDGVALEVTLRAPSNATGYRFSYRYWAFAEPGACDPYMDEFVALVSTKPAGSVGGNIAFDAAGTPISAKSPLFDTCSGCPSGAADLSGTGFDTWSTKQGPGGATSWLTSSAPVQGGGVFTVRFALWDGGDPVMDASVLIDHFEWLTDSGVEIGTEPLANPKAK